MAAEDEIIDRIFRAGEKQIELTHIVIEKHLQESDQIHARQASETLVKLGAEIVAANPT